MFRTPVVHLPVGPCQARLDTLPLRGQPPRLVVELRGGPAMSTPRFQLVPGGRLVHEPDAGGVGWRLLGANNRELGRAAIAYPDAEAALSAVQGVRASAAVGGARFLNDPVSGLWEWHLLGDDGRVIATSGRGFRHERECRYNLEQFREIAPSAP